MKKLFFKGVLARTRQDKYRIKAHTKNNKKDKQLYKLWKKSALKTFSLDLKNIQYKDSRITKVKLNIKEMTTDDKGSVKICCICKTFWKSMQRCNTSMIVCLCFPNRIELYWHKQPKLSLSPSLILLCG